MTEYEMAGWHHQLSAHGFGWTWELVRDSELNWTDQCHT